MTKVSSESILDVMKKAEDLWPLPLTSLYVQTDSEEGYTKRQWKKAFVPLADANRGDGASSMQELFISLDSCEFQSECGYEAITSVLGRILPDASILVADLYDFFFHGAQQPSAMHRVFWPTLLEEWQAHPAVSAKLRLREGQRAQDVRLAPLIPVLATKL